LNTADVVVDSYAGNVLVQWQTEQESSGFYERLREICQPATIYAQTATKQKRTKPVAVLGGPVPDRFPIRENGVTYLINFGEGLSTGIFLDQRENRRRLLRMPLAGKSVLNCFAYTCAFSVAAAKAGAVTTSVDLSRNHLEWGQANFRANELNSVFHADDRPVEKRNLPIGVGHEFLVGDVFEWLKRFAKRGRTWDVVLLDPPTFSTTKKGRGFQAERDYRELAALAVPLVARGGTLFGSTNQRTFAPAAFEQTLRAAVRQCGRDLTAVEFETLPFDFRLGEGERAYLKTFWLQLR
jgi:23S rRNA (cytosine1962-C5)-methyltransferase